MTNHLNSSVLIDTAINCLLNDGVVLLPTDTVYGLAVLPDSDIATDKIYHLKNRPRHMNLPFLIASIADLETMGLEINPTVVKLFESGYIPGALSLVVGIEKNTHKKYLEGREEVAVRIPDDQILLEIIAKTGPLLATSANVHKSAGTPGTVAEILAELNGIPDFIIDGGEIKTIHSTIVNCRFDPPTIEREGLIPSAEILNYLKNE
jgi:L-threonylcarbamoyladenylate synthase